MAHFMGCCILNRKKQLSRLFPYDSVWEQNVCVVVPVFLREEWIQKIYKMNSLMTFAFMMTMPVTSLSFFFLEHPKINLD